MCAIIELHNNERHIMNNRFGFRVSYIETDQEGVQTRTNSVVIGPYGTREFASTGRVKMINKYVDAPSVDFSPVFEY